MERSISSAASLNFELTERARPHSNSDGTFVQRPRSSSLMPPSSVSRAKSSDYSLSNSAKTAHVECIDFCDVGNILGETGILEQKVNEVDAICETDVQLFFIEREKVEMLIKEYPVLKERMWKLLGVHIASTLLIQQSDYQVFRQYSFLLPHIPSSQVIEYRIGDQKSWLLCQF